MDQNRIKITHHNLATIVELQDEEILTDDRVNQIAKSLFALVEQNHPIHMILNFTRVQRLSSITLGTLIRLSRRIEARNGSLRLCALNPLLKDLFTLTKLDRIFDLYFDQKSALRNLPS